MARYTKKKFNKFNKKKVKQQGGEASNFQRSFESMGNNIFEIFKNNVNTLKQRYNSTIEYANKKSQTTQSNIKSRINNLKTNITRRFKCLTD